MRAFRTSSALLAGFVATAIATEAQSSDRAGCELPPRRPPAAVDQYYQTLFEKYGGADFRNPDEVRPTSEQSTYHLVVKYADNTIAGCNVRLRSYNGKLVGDTIRVKPGDTIYVSLENELPVVSGSTPHPQDPLPGGHMTHQFSFNITNLHTHGLHTSPSGNSDNVLIEIDPQQTQEYRIHIPESHPAGLFWYHAHFHGSTALQMSSGMAGALIVEGGKDANGGLDAVPEIAAAQQKIFVLQQLRYGPDGQIEDFESALPRGKWRRSITVNGQFIPTIRMRPGEVQRWRFIHAGVEENINLSLDGHKLFEIATDGNALGRMVAWPGSNPSDPLQSLVLGPGYRTEVLVQANSLPQGTARQEFFLRDGPLPARLSLQAAAAATDLVANRTKLLATDILQEVVEKPARVIARVVVEGDPLNMALPTADAFTDRVPSTQKPIQPSELTGDPQQIQLVTDLRSCSADGDCLSHCDQPSDSCKQRYMVNGRVFNPAKEISLKLDHASKWTVSSGDAFAHPFHIHVNPFMMTRQEPDGTGKLVSAIVWKDTVSLPTDGTSISIMSRYTDFTGEFVLHCHILSHEDMGMMSLVKID